MRAILTLLLFLYTFHAQSQLFRTYRVQSDAYSLVLPNNRAITNIYVDKSSLNQDLSNLPYVQNLRLRLFDLGYSVTKDIKKANYIIRFNADIIGPIITRRETTESITTADRTVEVEGNNGSKKEITIEGQSTTIPVVQESRMWRKRLEIKLINIQTNELIWQGESWLDEQEPNVKYPKLLIYDALRHFLRNTQQHPILNTYSGRNLRKIRELFYVPKY